MRARYGVGEDTEARKQETGQNVEQEKKSEKREREGEKGWDRWRHEVLRHWDRTHTLWLGLLARLGKLSHTPHPTVGPNSSRPHTQQLACVLQEPWGLGTTILLPPAPENTGLREAQGSRAGVPLPRTSMRMLLSMPLATNLSSAPCRLAGTERMVTVCRVPSQRITYTLLAFKACPSRNHSPAEAEVRSTEKVTSLPSTASTAFRGVFTASWGTTE